MPQVNFPELEKTLVDQWKRDRIFERSVEERPTDKQFVFYDGPPFATGLPHYGHIVASTLKDVMPRYATMRGFRVERRWGWDCHGLPIENLIEKDLGLKTKQDIEAIGVAKFNDACKATVLTYAKEWRAVIERLGRWVDMDHDYRTMDVTYTESIWWAFKQLYDKGLIYEGRKAMHLCPRCETTLSNFEVTLGYKDITDHTVTAQFQLVDEPNTYILAWTTTPWTLPGNVALAVGPKVEYIKVAVGERYYIVAKDRAAEVFNDPAVPHEVIGPVAAQELVGKKYVPLFPYYQATQLVDAEKMFTLYSADFVTTTEGTGIVHIAGGYGEDDYQLCLREGLPIVQHVGRNGKFVNEVTDFVNQPAKPKGDPTETDKKIIAWLQAQDSVFSTQTYTHSYPHCWRCDTPLLNYAATSWFVKVTALKEKMIANNQTVNWMPAHVKDGRFGKWLEGAKDWAISRDRYWGAPLPIWQAEDGSVICVGSIAELRELSRDGLQSVSTKETDLTDLHKQYVDNVVIETNGKTYHRVSSVLDCWFESGSMPFAQEHYPFENEAKFKQNFPAQFIAEGLDQTRGWFYTLMVLSTALFDKAPFQNVIVNGLVLAEDGKKMSKKLKNYPETSIVFDKYGADALRFYLMSSPVVSAENLRFSEKGVDQVMKKLLLTLWNIFTFYQTFADPTQTPITNNQLPIPASAAVMDKWVLAYLSNVTEQVTAAMDAYDLQTATRALEQLVQEISTWYVRRSRDRFKDHAQKGEALSTLRHVLIQTCKLLAPFTPFITEHIYRALQGEKDSVHLDFWPEVQTSLMNEKLLNDMVIVRELVEQILAAREVAGLKVRQPLASVTIPQHDLAEPLQAILRDEVNVKAILFKDKIELNTTITPELAKEGMLREIVRAINALRKQQGLTIHDHVTIHYASTDPVVLAVFQDYGAELQRSVLAKEFVKVDDAEHELIVNKAKLIVTLQAPKSPKGDLQEK